MEITISEAIKKRVKEVMKEQHISENELATRAGVTTSTLNSFMKTKGSTCTMTTLGKICCGLGLTLAEFFAHPYFRLRVVGGLLVGEI